MYYRTRTYLAGDWDGDSDLIQTILEWKKKSSLTLDFTDAHDLMQARDNSLSCSIKKSLAERMNASKRFVLIVGNRTNTVTKGGCQNCRNYTTRNYYADCSHGRNIDTKSFIRYECEHAARDYHNGNQEIIVIYNSLRVYQEKCPEAVRHIGKHIAGRIIDSYGNSTPAYRAITDAIMGL